ncbi:MAG: hypothetical protein R3C03_04475 [Pirellulaceae bacterium]
MGDALKAFAGNPNFDLQRFTDSADKANENILLRDTNSTLVKQIKSLEAEVELQARKLRS